MDSFVLISFVAVLTAFPLLCAGKIADLCFTDARGSIDLSNLSNSELFRPQNLSNVTN